MSGLKLIVTAAGRAALPNPQHTGTQAVTISHIGVTAQAFTPLASLTALPGEIKRLSTIAGSAVAPDTLHVTLRDDSADVYAMRGFGLYLSDGTLFAVYGQSGVILQKSAQAMLLLATDTVFVDVDATQITLGDASWANPPATVDTAGVVRLASGQMAANGEDDQRAVTARGLRTALNMRFGDGAPSTFVKGLIGLATAALFRMQLGLGSAAVHDTGAGNGLDADLLDGQHGAWYRSWNNLTDVPTEFVPRGHRHPWGQIDGVPATASRWPTYAEVTGKPASFPPSAHGHGIADISGLQAALDGKQPAGSYASAEHTHTPAQVGLSNVPNLDFRASGLGPAGTAAQITGGSYDSHFSGSGLSAFFHASGGAPSDAPEQAQASGIHVGNSWGRAQVVWPNSGNRMYYRTGSSQAWVEVYTTGNFDPSTKLNANAPTVTNRMTLVAGSNANRGITLQNGAGTVSGGIDVQTSTILWGSGSTVMMRPNGASSSVGEVTVTPAGHMTVNGQLTMPEMNATNSDKRLKRKIRPIRNALAKLMQYRPSEWEWRTGRGRDFGFIAQWHEDVTPEAVYTDARGLKYVRYGKAEPLIVAAIQEISDRLDALDARCS